MATVVIIAETVLCSMLIVIVLFLCYRIGVIFYKIYSAIICQKPTRLKALCQATFYARCHLQCQDLCRLGSYSLGKMFPDSVGCVAIIRMQEANSSLNYLLDYLPLLIKRLKFSHILNWKISFSLISLGMK